MTRDGTQVVPELVRFENVKELRMRRIIERLLVVIGALFLLAGCGATAGTEAAPAETVTVEVTVTATATETATVTASPKPTPTPKVASFDGKPEDFEVPIKVTEMKCFGSAGCNITYRVDTPSYSGIARLPTTGTIEVTYRITGVEDTIIKSFEVSNGQVSWDAEGRASIKSDSDVIGTEVTDVAYRTY